MIRYIIRRLIYLVPLFFGILIIVFAASRIAGDPIALMTHQNPHITAEARLRLTEYYGLDKPIYVQLGIYIRDVLKGDFGDSIRFSRPVTIILIE